MLSHPKLVLNFVLDLEVVLRAVPRLVARFEVGIFDEPASKRTGS